MQALTRRETLRSSALAAALTTLAAYLRLAAWTDRPKAIWFLVAMLGVSSFVLWAFFFAWFPQAQGHRGIRWAPHGRHWLAATLCGLAGAVLLHEGVDPVLRSLTPEDYPTTVTDWTAGTLFTLGFVQLFLCFAPFAFFCRLLHDRLAAAIATVLFGVFLLGVQLNASKASPTPLFIAALFAIRVLSGSVALALLVRGGPLPVWWCALLLQTRLLVDLA